MKRTSDPRRREALRFPKLKKPAKESKAREPRRTTSMTEAPMKPAPTGLTRSCEPTTVTVWVALAAAAVSAAHPRSCVFWQTEHQVGMSLNANGFWGESMVVSIHHSLYL